jgi:hypothetical protein
MQFSGPRTDRQAFEIKATGAFANGEQLSDTLDLRDYPGGCLVWLIPSSLGSVTTVSLVAYASDDGSNVPITAGSSAKVLSDSEIDLGAFDATSPYKLDLSTASSTLTAGQPCGPLRLPQYAGAVKIGVIGNHASGAYVLKAQRFA